MSVAPPARGRAPRLAALLACALAAACAGALEPGAPDGAQRGDADLDRPGGDAEPRAPDAGAEAAGPGDAAPADASPAPVDGATADAAAPDAGPPDASVPPDSGTWRSALYPSDWTPAHTGAGGKFLHDFSYAGYARGERPVPTALGPAHAVTTFGADPTGATDSRAAIQAAIDAASASGGGVVRFPAGLYRVEGALEVSTSSVVLQGDGRELAQLYFATPAASDGAGLSFAGSPAYGPDVLLALDGEARSASVAVTDASGFAPGDDVDVGMVITDAFVAEHGMTGTWMVSNGAWRPFFRRTVLAVDRASAPARLVLDVPLRYPLRLRDGASVRRVTGLLHDVGLEDLGISDAVSLAEARAHDRVHAVAFFGVRDAWVRRVSSFRSPQAGTNHHLASGGVLVARSKRVTIDDVSLERAQNRGGGGNGYLFELMQASEVLVKDSAGRGGRHNFIQNWDFSTNGCVFLRVRSEDGRADDVVSTVALSEFHHSLAMANLIDGAVSNDGWGAVNRGSESSGAGHSATQNVFWNVRGGALRSMQFGWGYVIGTAGVQLSTTLNDLFGRARGTAPEDHVEGHGEGDRLDPASLYEDQLRRRLGP